MQAFDFTQADLEANREGYLSENQLAKFRADTRETLAVFRSILFILPLIGGIAILFGIYHSNNVFILTIVFFFTVIELLAFYLYKFMRDQTKIRSNQVSLAFLKASCGSVSTYKVKGEEVCRLTNTALELGLTVLMSVSRTFGSSRRMLLTPFIPRLARFGRVKCFHPNK
jgi:hypothetical protein